RYLKKVPNDCQKFLTFFGGVARKCLHYARLCYTNPTRWRGPCWHVGLVDCAKSACGIVQQRQGLPLRNRKYVAGGFLPLRIKSGAVSDPGGGKGNKDLNVDGTRLRYHIYKEHVARFGAGRHESSSMSGSRSVAGISPG